jgi:hypothetical protein
MALLKHGTTLANHSSVKISVNYRAVTVGIGILVAMVIALTLWIRSPKDTTFIEKPLSHKITASSLETFFHTALKALPGFFVQE